MLRLRELTAQVSATHASTKRFMSVSRGWKSNTAPGLFGQLGNDRKADDTRTGSPCV